MSFETPFYQDLARQIAEINLLAQPLEAIWGRVDSWSSSAGAVGEQFRVAQDALTRGALAQVMHFEDTRAAAAAAMQGLHQSHSVLMTPDLAAYAEISQSMGETVSIQRQFDGWRADTEAASERLLQCENAVTVGALALVGQFEATLENADAAMLRENRDALVAQAKISPIVDAMASISR